MQNFISPNKTASAITKSYQRNNNAKPVIQVPKTAYPRANKPINNFINSAQGKAAATKMQTYMRGTTHPFNPNYTGGKSQFVQPKK